MIPPRKPAAPARATLSLARAAGSSRREHADTVKSLKRPARKRELCSLGETLLGGGREGHNSDRVTRIRRLPSLPDVESEQEHKTMPLHSKVRQEEGNPGPCWRVGLVHRQRPMRDVAPSDDAPGIEEGPA